MTDIKFNILSLLYNSECQQILKADIYKSNIATPMQIKHNLSQLINELKYIKQPFNSNYVFLTDKGAVAYESEQQKRNDNAKQTAEKAAEKFAQEAQIKQDQKHQLRHDLFISAFSTLFGALVTLLIEHFQEIINIIRSLLP